MASLPGPTPTAILHGVHNAFTVNYSLVISICALLFTVTTFWWLNARQGKLKCYAPNSFAAVVRVDDCVLRFPFVLYNTGPKPIIVQDLRLSFPKETVTLPTFTWRTTRSKMLPSPDDQLALPAVFSVAGRSAQQIFIEFGGAFPGVAPEPRCYIINVEFKLGHRRKWRRVTSFGLHAENIGTPGSYIMYSNDPSALTDEERRVASVALRSMARGGGASAL